MRAAVDGDGRRMAWGLITLAWESRAFLAVAPMQDLLGLGSQARMNTPGSLGGNWTWRMKPGAAHRRLQQRLADLNRQTDRRRSG